MCQHRAAARERCGLIPPDRQERAYVYLGNYAIQQPNDYSYACDERQTDQSRISMTTQAPQPSATSSPTRSRATAKVTVHDSKATPFDETTSPALLQLQLNETFSGDIAGESEVRALQVRHDEHSASMVSMQRVRGKLGERPGTFVLQGTEQIEHGRIKATWFVVPGSGTGELAGLRGEGGFEGDFGRGSTGWLDYWFE